MRRAALNRYFSKASITKLEPLIHNLVNQLCNKLLARVGNGKPFDITMAYSCLTTDVISYYAFGQSEGFLEQEDFKPNLRPTVHAALRPAPYVRQWPFLFYLIANLPE
jgi:cytochrome P450